jgi:hypothetical protein
LIALVNVAKINRQDGKPPAAANKAVTVRFLEKSPPLRILITRGPLAEISYTLIGPVCEFKENRTAKRCERNEQGSDW